MLLRRTLIPALGQSLISESEMSISKRLYQMRMVDGAELEAFLLFDPNLGGVLKIVVKGAHGEDVRCSKLAESLRKLLVHEGATELEGVRQRMASPSAILGRGLGGSGGVRAMTFLKFVHSCSRTDDPFGDFIGDAQDDRKMPDAKSCGVGKLSLRPRCLRGSNRSGPIGVGEVH